MKLLTPFFYGFDSPDCNVRSFSIFHPTVPLELSRTFFPFVFHKRLPLISSFFLQSAFFFASFLRLWSRSNRQTKHAHGVLRHLVPRVRKEEISLSSLRQLEIVGPRTGLRFSPAETNSVTVRIGRAVGVDFEPRDRSRSARLWVPKIRSGFKDPCRPTSPELVGPH